MAYRQLQVAGLPALALSNDEIECVVIPSLGGKITNLRRRRGREWLWRDRIREIGHRPADGSFPDTGGWDECFPSIAAGPMPGAAPGEPLLPDHGELWSLDWHHDILETPTATVMSSRVEGKLLPYEFQRDLVMPHGGDAFRIEYRLLHRGTAPFPFLWAAHPLFTAAAGTTLTLPTVTQVKVDHAHGRPDLPPDAEVPWPLDDQAQSWRVPPVAGWSAKLFAAIGASGTAILVDPVKGEQLELQWDPAAIPFVGLWLDARTQEVRIGLEPALGAPDRLDRAMGAWRSGAVLGVQEHRRWRLTVRLPAFD